jgi:hypothetical protein
MCRVACFQVSLFCRRAVCGAFAAGPQAVKGLKKTESRLGTEAESLWETKQSKGQVEMLLVGKRSMGDFAETVAIELIEARESRRLLSGVGNRSVAQHEMKIDSIRARNDWPPLIRPFNQDEPFMCQTVGA